MDKPEVCPKCKGEGYTAVYVDWREGSSVLSWSEYIDAHPCPTCQGTGKVSFTIRECIEEAKG